MKLIILKLKVTLKQMRDTMETTTKTLPSHFGGNTASALMSQPTTMIGESQVPSRVTTRTTIHTQGSQERKTSELLERIAHLENKVNKLEKSGALMTVVEEEDVDSLMPSLTNTEVTKVKSVIPKINFAKEFTSRIKTPKISLHRRV